MTVYSIIQPSKLYNTPQNTLIVVDFFADWCAPCKNFAPKLDRLSNSYPEAIFYKVNVDDEAMADVIKQFGVTAMPTFVLLKNGNILGKVMGANEAELLAAIKQNL